MSFEGVDFYLLDDLLPPEERAMRDELRRWVEERVLPRVGEDYLAGRFPLELVPEMAELGLLGVQLEGYGCAGLSKRVYGLVCQELERGDSGIRSFVSVQSSLVMYPIWRYGSEEQKRRYLPELAAGRMVGCFGLTEPDHGSDPGSMRCRAVDAGDHYVLNGTKTWITNASIADVAVVWAKLDGVVRGFIVERGDPGFEQHEIRDKLSLRASVTGELSFMDCRVPKDRILPGVQGLRGPLSCLSSARYGIAWGAVGSAMACYEAARSYALERLQFGRPLASFQLVQAKLAWMLREITKAQLLVFRLAELEDAGRARHEQVSLAKMNNVEVAREVARMARDIHGANGISAEYPVMRHMANMEAVYTYEGTHDIHQLVLGRWITGIQAFR